MLINKDDDFNNISVNFCFKNKYYMVKMLILVKIQSIFDVLKN